MILDELRTEVEVAYVWVAPHGHEQDVEDNERNVDACEVVVVGELHDGVNNVKAVEDMEVDIHLEVPSHMIARAGNRLLTFPCWEADLLQQLSYYRRVPSRDAKMGSKGIRGEGSERTWEGMSDWPGAYYQL